MQVLLFHQQYFLPKLCFEDKSYVFKLDSVAYVGTRTLWLTFMVPLTCEHTLLKKQACIKCIKPSNDVLPCVYAVIFIVIAILLCNGFNDQEPCIFLQSSVRRVYPIIQIMKSIARVPLYVGSRICLLFNRKKTELSWIWLCVAYRLPCKIVHDAWWVHHPLPIAVHFIPV